MNRKHFSILKYFIPILISWLSILFGLPLPLAAIVFFAAFSLIYIPDLKKSLSDKSKGKLFSGLQIFLLIAPCFFILFTLNLHCTQNASFFAVIFVREQHIEEENPASKEGLFPMYQKSRMIKLRAQFALFYLVAIFIPFCLSFISRKVRRNTFFIYTPAGFVLIYLCWKTIPYWNALGGERAKTVAGFAFINAIICVSILIWSEFIKWIFFSKV